MGNTSDDLCESLCFFWNWLRNTIQNNYNELINKHSSLLLNFFKLPFVVTSYNSQCFFLTATLTILLYISFQSNIPFMGRWSSNESPHQRGLALFLFPNCSRTGLLRLQGRKGRTKTSGIQIFELLSSL